MISFDPPYPALLDVRPLTIDKVKDMLKDGFESVIGHQATADVLSALLDIDIPVNRTNIELKYGDKLIVFQLNVRLAEGQVLSREEVFDLYNQGKAKFILVEMV
jgi:hypothetical protein